MENELSTNINNIGMYPDKIKYNYSTPILSAPGAEIELTFDQTRETLLDAELYRNFINSAIKRFRSSRYYKAYKSYLMDMGMDHCQIFSNIIADDMATVEMHHNFLTIHDIAILITEHMLNTVGRINTFDLYELIMLEHKNNTIPIVMLSKTPHQAYHNDPTTFIPPDMTFGKWWELLYKYNYGITIEIAQKVIKYIDTYVNPNKNGNYKTLLLNTKNYITSWANYNEYGIPSQYCGHLADSGVKYVFNNKEEGDYSW